MDGVNEHKVHEAHMRRCIALARIAKERGESPVGSVIVREGEVIGEGIEGAKARKDVTCHAEIEAVRDAVRRTGSTDLSGCTLYTTHEPCIMCAYVIRHARIAAVVMGLPTGELGGASSAHPVLTDAAIRRWARPPRVVAGVLEAECRALHG